MRKGLLCALAALIVVFGGTFGFFLFKQRMAAGYAKHFTPPPVTVSATEVKAAPYHPKLLSVGSLKSVNGVAISSEVPGKIVAIYFHSGQRVEKGDPLIQLDTTVDQQTLKRDTSALRLAKLNLDRQQKLYSGKATAKKAVDETRARWEQLNADVAAAKATLAKKTISAPFSGKLGLRQVNLGEYLQPGSPIAALQSMQPLHVDFALPEQNLKDLHVSQPILIKVDGYPSENFKGRITALDSKVDQVTRTVMVQGTVPNHEERLYPGEFAKITVALPEQQRVILLPKTAIDYSLYGDSVYVLRPAKSESGNAGKVWTAEKRFVKLGARQNGKVIVRSGVKPGEYVVTSGQLKIHPGVRIIIDKKVTL